MFTPILCAAILAAWAFAIEKNTATAIVMIGIETFLLLGVIATVLTSLPAFLVALVVATLAVLITEHFSN